MKSNQCSAIFILMVFVSVKANPMPQEDESGNERTRTDLCDEFEFQEFVGDQVTYRNWSTSSLNSQDL